MAIISFFSFNTSVSETSEFYDFVDSTIYKMAEFDPVWGTTIGIHNFDSLMPDLTVGGVKNYLAFLYEVKNRIDVYDTGDWDIDMQIDHMLLKSEIEYEIFYTDKYRFWQMAPLYYFKKCYDGILLLAFRNSTPLKDRFPPILTRINAVPDILEKSKRNLKRPIAEYIYCSKPILISLKELIIGYSEILVDSFPEYNSEISTSRDKAVISIENYWKVYCKNLYDKADKYTGIGKENLDNMLSNYLFIDMDSDSLKNLAELTFKNADLKYRLIKMGLAPEEESGWILHNTVVSPPRDSVEAYCYGEVEFVKKFLENEKILSVPKDIPICLFKYLSHDINYEPYEEFYTRPGQLDLNQAGYYYTFFRMLDSNFGRYRPDNNFNEYFRMDVINNIIPGDHMLQYYAYRHPSKIRKIADYKIFSEGWKLYMGELLLERGFLGESNELLLEIYSELRSNALGTLADIKLHTGEIDLSEAQDLIYNRLNGDTASYKGDVCISCFYPTYHILIKARYMEGSEFDYREFHRKIISEGKIPPALIARKYGWD
jgi:hypothetical protein